MRRSISYDSFPRVFTAEVSNGDYEWVNGCIEYYGISYNLKKEALYIAVYFGHEEIVKSLLDNGVDIDGQNKYGETVWHHACVSENKNMEAYLINYYRFNQNDIYDQRQSCILGGSSLNLSECQDAIIE